MSPARQGRCHRHHRLVTLSTLVCATASAVDVDPSGAPLVIGFTEWEWANRHLVQDIRRSKLRRTPKLGSALRTVPVSLRTIPEYGSISGSIIRYPLGITTALCKALAEVGTLYVLVNRDQTNTARATLFGGGVAMDKVEFIIGATDSVWARDYGPLWAYDETGSLTVTDFTYNRPRPNDNQVPLRVADHLGIELRFMDMVNTGGNVMTNTTDTVQSHILYTENNECQTDDEASVPLPPCVHVDTQLRTNLGIGGVHVLADPVRSVGLQPTHLHPRQLKSVRQVGVLPLTPPLSSAHRRMMITSTTLTAGPNSSPPLRSC